MKNKYLNKLSPLFLYIIFFIFIIAFNFSDSPPGGWQRQFFPFLNNRAIADITFLDSLTGYAVTGDGVGGNDTDYILKTTNAGSNWDMLISKIYDFSRISFLNPDTGFALHGDEILRTTNAGFNWNRMPVPPDNFGFYDMYPISWDTMWVSFPYVGGEYIYRTTNAGLIWTYQVQRAGIEKLYFFNGNIGFAGAVGINVLLKTTNSGINWFQLPNQNGFGDIQLIDSLNGWKCYGDEVKKTSDGGISWEPQLLPTGPLVTNYMVNFSIINPDTIWGVGGYITYPGSGITNRGIVYRTTNGGVNWAYQISDTSFRIPRFQYVNFLNKNTGWCYAFMSLSNNANGIHTVTGGDTNFITNINQIGQYYPKNFILNQNYPNPFNPETNISYSIEIASKVKLVVYSILGKEIATLVEENQNRGIHQTQFDGSNLHSGIYFYSLFINNERMDTKKMILIK
ncbi:MAG: T9SS type A sorting domain-containing protein [bacterium]|nr:T9SS type A sorting domain-containing protein [bacterium]